MRFPELVVTVIVVLGPAVAGVATATTNTPPMPEAGLDQDVRPNATVHLDANGSRDPDGSIAGVEWEVESPDGDTLSPECDTCRQTQFQASAVGQYNVTLSVTDDDGATRSDSLVVDVTPAGGPSVSLSVPTVAVAGSQRTVSANASAGDAHLRTLAWVINGSHVNRTRLSGDNRTATLARSFDSSGTVSVRAVVYDAAGHRAASTRTFTVVSPTSSTGSGGGGNDCPGGTSGYYHKKQFKGCTDAASMVIDDTVADVDGKPGVWLHIDGELEQVASEKKANSLSQNGMGNVFKKDDLLDNHHRRDKNNKKIMENKREIMGEGNRENDGGNDDDGNTDGDRSDIPDINHGNPGDRVEDKSEDIDDDGFSEEHDSGHAARSLDGSTSNGDVVDKSGGSDESASDESDSGNFGGLLDIFDSSSGDSDDDKDDSSDRSDSDSGILDWIL